MCLQAHQCRVRCHTTTRNDWKVTLTENFVSVNRTHYCARHIHLVYSPRKRIFWPARKGNLTSFFFFFFIVSGCYEESRHYQGNTKCRNEQRRVSELFLWEIIPTDSDRSFPHPSLRFKFLKRIPLFSNYCKFLHFVWCWRWSFSLFS